MSTTGRIVRLTEFDRAAVQFFLDGEKCSALAGDTVLTAILASGHALRNSEFGPEPRAGFCLMGACQDCWLWQETGPRLRACSTPVTEGMRLRTTTPENWP
ncbi:(2Fe-2S)-binding protein [Mesorhizobium sp.]|jgi:predicted molibdopterin-dependent oxidoreductase YjgC|uniref:(2Fe-2S)-binding protein n=1 Tax=Mesorhizobium sp. TaxID=1871066 RepID=UPI000FE382A6|nr:(2Fe-2S)-binding protein [Mesorhizobium sp.]RWH75831.1 MAG: (2Fe-2S)-binding protein [Mesorhizobium sp.]RWL28931.1 MAG: (2Fe-2S)-binding protein [Mesorhizobium sp.]RWL30876.1 MAG: (2Fe-2S)-binding protein [Mesorhizobium sp.]RWL37353.1 MAG: (2Fe-2S)-binding protein [Mesorhizobium sp.]RWL52028.1 MAG: (2Fe-2S)-binding protein [Mesorhizobium sp.]